MKHGTFEEYSKQDLELPQQALLTAWDCLAVYQDDLVLVGGLAVKFLTNPPGEGLPGPVTMDVDFGIKVAASGGMYGSIRETLSGHGFRWDPEKKRFVQKFETLDLYIDLLTDDGKGGMGTAIVDDGLPVGTVPGIDRALAVHRFVSIEGETLYGAETKQSIRVADVGPMLALKLNAFGGPKGRKTPKDAHDILFLAMNYMDGLENAIQAFHEEKRVGNMAVPHALKALESYYANPDSEGPLACAAFRMNNQHLNPELEEESMQLRQQCVTLAQELLS